VTKALDTRSDSSIAQGQLGDLGVIKRLMNILPSRGAHHAARLRLRGDRAVSMVRGAILPFARLHKSAVMREFAVPEESRQHRQRVIGEGLIDERLLPLKRLYGTAGG